MIGGIIGIGAIVASFISLIAVAVVTVIVAVLYVPVTASFSFDTSFLSSS